MATWWALVKKSLKLEFPLDFNSFDMKNECVYFWEDSSSWNLLHTWLLFMKGFCKVEAEHKVEAGGNRYRHAVT
jgi:hypothetical protein